MKPLLVGELNPYGAEPAMALYPLPFGASGHRLVTIFGIGPGEYMDRFDRVNLCTGTWGWDAAFCAARRLLDECRPAYVLLGAKVRRAFSVAAAVQIPASFMVVKTAVSRLYSLPHPSGRCREWNDLDAVRRARDLLVGVL